MTTATIPAAQAEGALARLEANVEQIIRGKSEVVRLAIIGLLAHGHILFEDVPGVGKTTLAHCIARSLGLRFQRIQFTSDLMPSDILGVTVYDPEKREFEFRPGPIFANVVLVDEINRTTPKTQSALLEAMNTAKVSIEKVTYDLPSPFFLIATQNPVEVHGTFPLPQSQLDRFMMRLHLGYPEADFEREILKSVRAPNDLSGVQPVLSGEELAAMQAGVLQVRVDEGLIDYIVRFVGATRQSELLEVGVSTRGALALRRCAQARAYSLGRDYCVPDDVKAMAVPVLAHRITPSRRFLDGADGVGHGRRHIEAILEEVEVPI